MTPLAPPARSIAVAVAVTLALSCASAPEETGDLDVVVAVRSELVIPVGITWIRLSGTGTAGALLEFWAKTAVTATGAQASFLGVPTGSYLVDGMAYTDPKAVKRAPNPDFLTPAPVAVTVTAKAPATLTLVLQQNRLLHPPATVVNSTPSILSILASASELDPTDAGAGIDLTATVTDANDLPASLVVAWTAAYAPQLPAGVAPGTFSAPAALSTRYVPPAGYDGTVTLTLAVTDPLGATSAQAVAAAVTPKAAKGNVVVIAGVNNHPDITALTTLRGELPPSAPGLPSTTSFSVVASDADLTDVLRYAWTDGCGGVFGTPTAATTTWTAPALPGACLVSVTVTDWTNPLAPAVPVARGGTNTARLTVQVMAPANVTAPQLVYATQAPASPVPGGAPASPVRFRVVVVETSATGATVPVSALAWTSDAVGTVFTPVVPGALDYVAWTPPACTAPGTLPYTVTLTATGSLPPGGGVAPVRVFAFPVTVLCP